MKSIKDKHLLVEQGKLSKQNFVKEARQALPTLITPMNSYGDVVRILKSKSILENISLSDIIQQLEDAEIGSTATGGGYGPFKKVRRNSWQNTNTNSLQHSQALASHIGTFGDFQIKAVEKNETSEVREDGRRGDFDGIGIVVIAKSETDNTLIKQAIEERGLYGLYNTNHDYWFFPAEGEAMDILEDELDTIFSEKGIDARIDGQFDESEREGIGRDINENAINSDYKYIYKKIIQKYPDVVGNWDLIKSFVDDEISNIEITDTQDILSKFNEYRRRKFKGVVSKTLGRDINESQEGNTLQHNFSLEAVKRGIRYEASLKKLKQPIERDEYKKLEEKVLKNLEKDQMYYLNKLSGQKKEDNTAMEKATGKNVVDKKNQMIKGKIVKESKSLDIQQLALDLIKKHPNMTWTQAVEKVKGSLKEESTSKYTVRKGEGFADYEVWKDDSKEREFSGKDALEKARAFALQKRREQGLKEEDLERVERGATNPYGTEDEYDFYNSQDLDWTEYGNSDEEITEENSISGNQVKAIAKAVENVSIDGAEKLKELTSIFEERIPKQRVQAIMKNYNISKDSLIGNIAEGRAPKLEGGKHVREDDYSTGGYIEVLGPHLVSIIKDLQKVWNKWREAPLTRPGMEPYAKEELLQFIGKYLPVAEPRQEQEPENKAGEEETLSEVKQKLKEAFKRKITNILSEQAVNTISEKSIGKIQREWSEVKATMKATVKAWRKAEGVEKQELLNKLKNLTAQKKRLENELNTAVSTSNIDSEFEQNALNEATTVNLEKYVHYENPSNEDLAARIRKEATTLEDIIGKLDKTYTDTREKVESAYKNVGSYMAPALAAAFKADIKPVLDKYVSIKLPKADTLQETKLKRKYT